MIHRTAALDALETRAAREELSSLTFHEALSRFTGLWIEARAVRPDLGDDWEQDLAADFAVARAVNGLPPAA